MLAKNWSDEPQSTPSWAARVRAVITKTKENRDTSGRKTLYGSGKVHAWANERLAAPEKQEVTGGGSVYLPQLFPRLPPPSVCLPDKGKGKSHSIKRKRAVAWRRHTSAWTRQGRPAVWLLHAADFLSEVGNSCGAAAVACDFTDGIWLTKLHTQLARQPAPVTSRAAPCDLWRRKGLSLTRGYASLRRRRGCEINQSWCLAKYLRQVGRRDSLSWRGSLQRCRQWPRGHWASCLRESHQIIYALIIALVTQQTHTHKRGRSRTQNNTAVRLGNPKTRPTYSKFIEPKEAQ